MWLSLLFSPGTGILAGLLTWWLLTRRYRWYAFEQACRRLGQMTSEGLTTGFPGDRSLHLSLGRRSKSQSPWIPPALASRVSSFLEQANTQITPGVFMLATFTCFLTTSLIAWVVKWPPIAALILVGLATAAPFYLLEIKRQRRLTQMNGQLPDAVRLIASAMRAGLGFEVGLELVVSELQDPIQGEFRKLMNEWRLSSDMNAALRHMSERVALPDVRLFSVCARLHREVGGDFTQVLDRLGNTVRERFQLRKELKSLTAESRLTGLILGIFPVLIGVALTVFQPDYLRTLIEEPLGQTLLWTAVGLQIIGMGIIRWLTNPRLCC